MLLALGEFFFSIDDLLFQELQRKRSWRHPQNDRVGARAASQFAGPGDDTITIGGNLMPGLIGRFDALEDLAAMGDAGAAFPLVTGEGDVYGAYVITDLDETKKHFLILGQPRAIDFSLSLRRVDDDAGETGAQGQTVRP